MPKNPPIKKIFVLLVALTLILFVSLGVANPSALISLSKEDTFHVKKNEWHQIINPYKEVCKIIEIQYGEKVEETDVERLFYFNEEKIQK